MNPNPLYANAIVDTKWDAFVDDSIRNATLYTRNLVAAGQTLLYLRENGLDREWLAKQSGLSRTDLDEALKGRAGMTKKRRIKIEQATGLKLK